MPVDQAEAIVLRTTALGEQDKLVVPPHPGQGRAAGRGQGRPEVREPLRELARAHVPRDRPLLRKGAPGAGHDQRLRPRRVLLRDPERPRPRRSPWPISPSSSKSSSPSGSGRTSPSGSSSRRSSPSRPGAMSASSAAISRPGSSRSTDSCPTSTAAGNAASPSKNPAGCRRARTASTATPAPQPAGTRSRPELGRFLAWARKNPPSAAPDTPFSPAELRSIERSLQAMIVFHLEREPKSLRFVRS